MIGGNKMHIPNLPLGDEMNNSEIEKALMRKWKMAALLDTYTTIRGGYQYTNILPPEEIKRRIKVLNQEYVEFIKESSV